MTPIIEKPLELLKSLFFLTFPMLEPEGAARAGDPAARWLGRIVLVGAVLGVLAAVNQWAVFGLPNVIRASSPWIARTWLPLLALGLYAMLWLGWWLYRLLNLDIEPVGSEFPDIDRAWGLAVQALERADIRLTEAPLFLVLGWPSSTEADLYRAAGIKGPVRQVPNEPDAPLHVTANRDGIWLTCPGASLLGRYREVGPAADAREEVMATMAEEAGDAFGTMAVGAASAGTLRLEDFHASFAAAQEQGRAGRPMRVEDADLHLARLRHLARLIARDRKGFCPINGVLLTFPLGVDARPDLAEIAAACGKDLATAFETFRLRCPVLALINGMEQVEGFAQLVERLPAEQVRKRMGQRFPLVPDLTAGEVPEKVEDAVDVVTGTLFPSMVHAMFQVESKGLDDADEALRANIELFRFLRGIVERGDRIGRLIRDGIPNVRGEPVMFGGCYFAGTGSDSVTQQAFAAGVLMRMIKEDQDSVTWTQEAMDRDASAARMAGRVRLALIAIIVLGALAAAGLVGRRFVSPAGSPDGAVSETGG